MFKRFWWMFLVTLPVGAVLGWLTASVVTYVMPKKYESDATIQIMPPRTDSEMVGGARTITPRFFADEFEIITSTNTLGKVIANLELTNRWNVDRNTAMRMLRGMVNTQNIRGTDLISIRVRHTNKAEARDIAGEVVHAYKEYRDGIEAKKSQAILGELNKVVRDQEDKVEERRKVRVNLMKRTSGFLRSGFAARC